MKCKHTPVIYSWHGGEVVAKRCSPTLGCGEYLPLGPANGSVQIEIDAADLIAKRATGERPLFTQAEADGLRIDESSQFTGNHGWEVGRLVAEHESTDVELDFDLQAGGRGMTDAEAIAEYASAEDAMRDPEVTARNAARQPIADLICADDPGEPVDPSTKFGELAHQIAVPVSYRPAGWGRDLDAIEYEHQRASEPDCRNEDEPEPPGDAFMRRTAGMVRITEDDMRTRIGRKS